MRKVTSQTTKYELTAEEKDACKKVVALATFLAEELADADEPSLINCNPFRTSAAMTYDIEGVVFVRDILESLIRRNGCEISTCAEVDSW